MKQICLLILIQTLFSSCSIEKNNPLIYTTSAPLRIMNPEPFDSDHDGVPDKTDKEKKSPMNAVVDLNGISIDSDMDGCMDAEDPEPVSDLKKQMKGCENVILSPDSIKKYVEICRIKEYNNLSRNQWYLPMIFFDYKSSAIRNYSKIELDYIAEIMNAYSNVLIELSGHRIDIGNMQEPPEITDERSQSV